MTAASRMLSRIAIGSAVLVAVAMRAGGQTAPVKKRVLRGKQSRQSNGLVEERRDLRGVPAQLSRHQWRRDRRSERDHEAAWLPQRSGVDAIWLTPVYPSPHVDFGYDISNYLDIDPQYGTLADFDRLVAGAKRRHIRVILDMVMNHTSDQHEWFIQSRSSLTVLTAIGIAGRMAKARPQQTKACRRTTGNRFSAIRPGGGTKPRASTTTHKYLPSAAGPELAHPRGARGFQAIIAFWLKRGVGGFASTQSPRCLRIRALPTRALCATRTASR